MDSQDPVPHWKSLRPATSLLFSSSYPIFTAASPVFAGQRMWTSPAQPDRVKKQSVQIQP